MTAIYRTLSEQPGVGRPDKSWASFNSINRSTQEVSPLRVGSSSLFSSVRAAAIAKKDRTPPIAILRAAPIATPGTGAVYTFQVVYRDPRRGSGIRPGTITTGNLEVTGPNGFNQRATLVSRRLNRSKTRAVATYSLVAPDGVWDATENGTYQFRIRRNQTSGGIRVFTQVRDFRGNRVRPRPIGSVNFNLPNAAPTASLLSQSFSGAGTYTFSVQYADDIGIAQSSIDGSDILVTGSNGFSQTATLTSVTSSSNGTQTATYRVDAPGGTWDAPDNGTYNIFLQANQVSDRLGISVPANSLGTFSVNANTIPASASLSPVTSAFSGQGAKTFTVTYTDNGGVRLSSIDSNDIRVTGPGGFNQSATFVRTTVMGGPVQATYSVTPPGGTWDASETGTYEITLQGNQIEDSDGNFSPQTSLGSFRVNPATVRVEAENFVNRQNIRVESRNFVSGGSIIRVDDLLTGSVGRASSTFTGASGVYNIRVGYFDETDGTAQINLRVGALSLPTINLNQDLGDATADTPKTYVQRTIATNVTVNQNDAIAYVGTFNGDEASRFDYIEFVPV